MTIREGAYLTDHTYSYEEVVRMMGEIAACLKGHIRVCVDVLISLSPVLNLMLFAVCQISIQCYDYFENVQDDRVKIWESISYPILHGRVGRQKD